jgi:hypothetical protein
VFVDHRRTRTREHAVANLFLVRLVMLVVDNKCPNRTFSAGCGNSLRFVPYGAARLHKATMALSSIILLVMVLLGQGFSGGSSAHAHFAWTLVWLWVTQFAVALAREIVIWMSSQRDGSRRRRVLPLLPHRYFGVVVVVALLVAFGSGLEHALGKCSGVSE